MQTMTTTTGDARLPAAGAVEASRHTTPAPGSPLVYDLRAAAYPPAQHDVDLAAATRLELGLAALESGDMPAAFSALAAIPEADWQAIVRRFPMLPAWIEQEARR
jgi:hypothetical protein